MPKTERITLDQHLCFTIYAASRAITRLYRPVLQELGITYPQYLVLLVLWEHESISVKYLGKILDLDTGTLTPLLKRMETMGLIVRERNPKDERSVMIGLTEKGRKMEEKATSIPRSFMDNTGLTVEQITRLDKTLKESFQALRIQE